MKRLARSPTRSTIRASSSLAPKRCVESDTHGPAPWTSPTREPRRVGGDRGGGGAVDQLKALDRGARGARRRRRPGPGPGPRRRAPADRGAAKELEPHRVTSSPAMAAAALATSSRRSTAGLGSPSSRRRTGRPRRPARPGARGARRLWRRQGRSGRRPCARVARRGQRQPRPAQRRWRGRGARGRPRARTAPAGPAAATSTSSVTIAAAHRPGPGRRPGWQRRWSRPWARRAGGGGAGSAVEHADAVGARGSLQRFPPTDAATGQQKEQDL